MGGHLVPLPPLLPTFVTLSTLSTPRPHSATLPGYHLMRTSRATVWVAPLSVLRSLIPLLQPLLTPPMRPMGKSPRLVVLGLLRTACAEREPCCGEQPASAGEYSWCREHCWLWPEQSTSSCH